MLKFRKQMPGFRKQVSFDFKQNYIFDTKMLMKCLRLRSIARIEDPKTTSSKNNKNIMKKYLQNMVLFSLLMLSACGKPEGTNDPSPGTGNPTDQPLSITGISPLSARVGEKVVITGTGFSKSIADNSIKFGNTAAVVDSASQTRLVTKVPQGAQNGKINVTVNNKTVSSVNEFNLSTAPSQPVFAIGSGANGTSEITNSSAKAKSTIEKLGDQAVIQYGHVWIKGSVAPSLSSNNGKSELGQILSSVSLPFSFNSNLTNLESNTRYTICGYVTTSNGLIYGTPFTFTTAINTNGVACQLKSITRKNSMVGTSITNYVYDSKGFISKVLYESGLEQAFSYSEDGELISSVYSYKNPSSNQIDTDTYTFSYTDKKLSKYTYEKKSSGRIESAYTYNVTLNQSGKVSSIQQFNPDNSINQACDFNYDAAGNIVSFAFSGKYTTKYEISYGAKPSPYLSLALTEAHKIALSSSISYDLLTDRDFFYKYAPLTVKQYDKDWSGNYILSERRTIYTYSTYTDEGFPHFIKLDNSDAGIWDYTFIYNNCK